MLLTNSLRDRIEIGDTYRSNLMTLLHRRAQITPDAIAYIYLRDGENDEEIISYSQLYEIASSIAQVLLQKTKPGDRALMLYPPGLDFVKALFACFYAGIIAVPAYPPRKNRSIDRILTLVKDSGPGIVLSTEDIRQTSERSFSDITDLQKLTWISSNNSSISSSTPPRSQASMPPTFRYRTSPVHFRLHRQAQRSHGDSSKPDEKP